MNLSTGKFIRNPLLTATLTVLLILLLVFNAEAGKIVVQSNQGYCLGVPSVVSSGKALPVLICLPGWGVAAANDINVWSFPAEKKGFLLVDLDLNYAESTVAEVYERIQTIVRHLSTSYNIDKDNIFIAGTSAGGMMALSLVLSYPGKFKATGVVSGARLDSVAARALANAEGQRFYLAHGTEDRSIPIDEFYQTKDALLTNGAVIEFKVVSQGGHTLPSGNYKEAVDWFYQLLGTAQ